MDGLIQWRNVEGAHVQVFLDAAHAGHSRCTIVVPAMDEARQFLRGAGLTLTGETEGTFGRIGQLRDPAGNLITLAEPPR